MARCPKLEFDGSSTFYNDCKYICSLTRQQFSVDSAQVKYTCKPEYGENYKTCDIYKKYG